MYLFILHFIIYACIIIIIIIIINIKWLDDWWTITGRDLEKTDHGLI
jgi:hypothetical protein